MAEIAVRRLKKIYEAETGHITALSGIDLAIGDGQFVSLVGASGCGKTTLLNLVAGFEHPTEGDVLVNGVRVQGPGPDRGVVFQQSALFPWLTVCENVNFGLRLAANVSRARPGKVDEIIARIGLEKFANVFPAQLSGGMRQRAAIASVLAIEPEVLLMDEPFGALDSLTRSLMQDFLLEIWEAERKTVMLITHDITESIYLADRVIVMGGDPGRILEIIDIDLPRPRNFAIQGSARFIALREHVTAIVREEVTRSSRHLNA